LKEGYLTYKLKEGYLTYKLKEGYLTYKLKEGYLTYKLKEEYLTYKLRLKFYPFVYIHDIYVYADSNIYYHDKGSKSTRKYRLIKSKKE
jgi:hypothetical protein